MTMINFLKPILLLEKLNYEVSLMLLLVLTDGTKSFTMKANADNTS